MTETNRINRKPLACRVTEDLFLAFIGLYLLKLDLVTTTFKLKLPDHIDRLLIVLLAAAAMARLAAFLISSRSDSRRWLGWIAAALVTDAVYFMVYMEHHYKFLVFLAVLTLGTVGMEYDRVLKVYVTVTALILASAVSMAWCGGITNYVYIRGVEMRSAWGIGYPTDLASYFLFLVMFLWAICRKTRGIWFVLPGLLVLLLSDAVADSRTSTVCCIAFILTVCSEYVFLEGNLKDRFAELRKLLAKPAEVLVCGAFPILTVLMNALVIAYRRGNSVVTRIDAIMSGRLSIAAGVYDEHGVSLFGTFFEQIGNGGTTFVRSNVNFVDISYNLILLRYGIVILILFNVLWVLMTRRLIRNRDYRLALVMVLIAIHAAVEHHFIEVNYNILLAMPFAVMTAPAPDALSAAAASGDADAGYRSRHDRRETVAKRIPAYAGWGIGAILAGIAAFLCPLLLRRARTVITLSGLSEEVEGRRILFVVSILLASVTLAGIYAVYRLLRSAVNGNTKHRKLYACTAVCFFLAVGACWTVTSGYVAEGMEKSIDMLEEERSAIETVQNAGGRLYAYGLPEIYDKCFGNISTSLFDGEELARYKDTTVVFNGDVDSLCFFNTGFLYTQISGEHALFTNDRKVINALQEGEYHLTGYFPLKVNVDMKTEAEDNDLALQEDGSILLRGEDEDLKKGPRTDLRGGPYTFSCDLALPQEENTAPSEDDELCRIRITADKGDTVLFDTAVYNSQFDENGRYTAEIRGTIPDSMKVDIRILPDEEDSVYVRSMAYQKTPEYDVHSTYDENGNKTREDYFDLKGKPYAGNWGYTSREMEYDSGGNIIKETYYDVKGDKTLNTEGYCELRRTFNILGQNIKEEYFGLDGSKTALETGQAATCFEYDDYGRVTGITFYDINDEPVMIGAVPGSGYHKIVRDYDEDGHIIRECFLGIGGEPEVCTEGYSACEYKYDENGNMTGVIFYDQQGNKAVLSGGYCEVRREYDDNNIMISESYYGKEGELIQ